jgi:hypothetical protein
MKHLVWTIGFAVLAAASGSGWAAGGVTDHLACYKVKGQCVAAPDGFWPIPVDIPTPNARCHPLAGGLRRRQEAPPAGSIKGFSALPPAC